MTSVLRLYAGEELDNCPLFPAPAGSNGSESGSGHSDDGASSVCADLSGSCFVTEHDLPEWKGSVSTFTQSGCYGIVNTSNSQETITSSFMVSGSGNSTKINGSDGLMHWTGDVQAGGSILVITESNGSWSAVLDCSLNSGWESFNKSNASFSETPAAFTTHNGTGTGSWSGGSDDGPPPFTDLDFDPADGCVTESEFDARKGDGWPDFGDIAGFAQETDTCEGILEADINAFTATQAGGGSGCGSGSGSEGLCDMNEADHQSCVDGLGQPSDGNVDKNAFCQHFVNGARTCFNRCFCDAEAMDDEENSNSDSCSQVWNEFVNTFNDNGCQEADFGGLHTYCGLDNINGSGRRSGSSDDGPPPFNTGNVNLSGSGSGGGNDESSLSSDLTLSTFVRQLIQRVQLACFMDGDTMCFPKYLSLVTSDGFENGLSDSADLTNRLSQLCDPCLQKLMKVTADQQTANMLDLMCAKDLDVSIRLDQKEFS